MAYSAPSSSTSPRLHNWSGVLVLASICLTLTSSYVTSRVDYGLVFSRTATISLTSKYVLRNLTLPLPKVEDFQSQPMTCRYEVGVRCPFDSFVTDVVNHVRAESGFYLHSEIIRTVEELGTGPFPFPDHLYAGLRFLSDDLMQQMNMTSEAIGRHKAAVQENIDDFWNVTLSGTVPTEQLPVLLQSVMLQSLEARITWYYYARGFRQLLQGRLSHAIVPESVVQEEMYKIISNQENMRFRLEDIDINKYYRHSRVKAVTFQEGNLIVTLAFPITTADSMLYDLYDVSTFPVLYESGDVILSSRVEGIPRFLAVARNGHVYSETDKWDDSECEGLDDDRTCLVSLPWKPSTDPSCLLAVFLNDTIAARTKCSFFIQRETSVPSSAMEVSPDLILWTNASSITATCPDSFHSLPGCLQCLIPASCSCSMHSAHVQVPPSLAQCQTSPPSRVFLLENRGLMFRLLSQQQRASLDGNEQHAEERATTARVGEDEVANILSQNRLGSFPMSVDELRDFVESLNEPKDESRILYRMLLQAAIGFAVVAGVSMLAVTAWLLWLERQTALIKQRWA